MKASELRIGNLVNHIRKGPIVVGIMELDFIEKEVLDIEPIPLTKKWLGKFGFIRIAFEDFDFPNHDFAHFIICHNDYGWTVMLNRQTVITINHVHQLQNLYFALTGEELTIKE